MQVIIVMMIMTIMMMIMQVLGWLQGPLCNDGNLAQSDYTQLTVTLILSVTNLSLLPAIMLSLYRSVKV